MWKIVRQFFIVLHLALGDPMIGHALPQNRSVNNGGLRQIINTFESAVVSNVKPRLNLSNASSTGKPTTLTVSMYSTFSNRETHTTIVKTSTNFQTSGDIPKGTSSEPPVVFPTSSPFKTRPATKRIITTSNPPTSMFGSRPPNDLKPCQKVVAGALCDDDIDYPTDVARALFQSEHFKSLYAPYFSNQVASKMNAPAEVDVRLNTNNPNEGYIPICAVNDNNSYKQPLQLMNSNKTWKLILQSKGADNNYNDDDEDNINNLFQTVRTEVCVSAESPCNLLRTLNTSYQSRCVQKYSLQKLVWFDKKKNVGIDEFHVPSCCSCSYRPITDDFELVRRSNMKKN